MSSQLPLDQILFSERRFVHVLQRIQGHSVTSPCSPPNTQPVSSLLRAKDVTGEGGHLDVRQITLIEESFPELLSHGQERLHTDPRQWFIFDIIAITLPFLLQFQTRRQGKQTHRIQIISFNKRPNLTNQCPFQNAKKKKKREERKEWNESQRG
jgi:hypothetical protein